MKIYAFDPVGNNPDNKIVAESHSVNSTNNVAARMFVPNAGPFHGGADKLRLVFVSPAGVTEELDYESDFYPVYESNGLSVSLSKPVYRAIALNRTDLNGAIYIDYQTVGGEWSFDRPAFAEWLADKIYNDREISMDQVENLPDVFPPGPHRHPFTQVKGQDALVQGVVDIQDALVVAPNIALKDMVITAFANKAFTVHFHAIENVVGLEDILQDLQSQILQLPYYNPGTPTTPPTRPTITSVTAANSGFNTTFTLTGSAYAGESPMASSTWEISRSSDFTDLQARQTLTTGNLLTYSGVVNNVDNGTIYFRVRYRSQAGVYSEWSPTQTYQFVQREYARFVITGTSFSMTEFAATNVSVDWGDGTTYSATTTSLLSKTYATAATRLVTIGFSTLTRLRANPSMSLVSVQALGTNTISDWSNAFAGCTSLSSVTQIYTSAGTNFASMFSGCISLVTLPTLVTALATSVASMFEGCVNLSGYPLGTLPLVQSASRTFFNCTNLPSFPAISLPAATTVISMFEGCTRLASAGALNAPVSTDFSRLYYGCANLATFDTLTTTAGTLFVDMFRGCAKMVTAPTLNLTNATSITRMFYGCSELVTVGTLTGTNITSISELFRNCAKLVTAPNMAIGTITSMLGVYAGCAKLTSIPNTPSSSVTNWSYFVQGCAELVSVPNLQTSAGTNFSYMFQGCVKLTAIPSTITTALGTNFLGMFSGCVALLSIPALDLSASAQMFYSPSGDAADDAFYNCTAVTSCLVTGYRRGIRFASLTALSLADTKALVERSGAVIQTSPDTQRTIVLSAAMAAAIEYTDVPLSVSRGWLFSPILSLRRFSFTVSGDTVSLPTFTATGVVVDWGDGTGTQTLGDVTSISKTYATSDNRSVVIQFRTLTALKVAPATRMLSVTALDVNGITSFQEAFKDVVSLSTVSGISTTQATNFAGMFYGCTGLVSVATFDTSKATTALNMYRGCTNLTTIGALAFPLATTLESLLMGCTLLQTIPTIAAPVATSTKSAFSGCSRLTAVGFTSAAAVTDGSGMFQDCSALTTISGFTPSAITNMAAMYSGCTALATYPSYAKNAVTNMSQAFLNCASFTAVPAQNFSAATTLAQTFAGCSALTSVGALTTTTALTTVSGMFSDCLQLPNIPTFVTTNVTDMSSFAENCRVLAALGTYTTTNVANFSRMLYNCATVSSVGNLNMAGATSLVDTFYGCRSITTIGVTGYRPDANFKDMASISTANLIALINASGTASNTPGLITLSETQAVSIEPAQVASATGRGWTFTPRLGAGYFFDILTDSTSFSLPVFNATRVTISEVDIANPSTVLWTGDVDQDTTQITIALTEGSSHRIRIRFLTLAAMTVDAATRILRIYSLGTNQITNAVALFKNHTELTAVDSVSLGSATNVGELFSGCTALATVSQVGIAAATSATSMFEGCSALQSITTLTTSAALTSVSRMFYGCTLLAAIPVFTTSGATNWNAFARNATSLTIAPALNTAAGLDFRSMYAGCTSLTSITGLNFAAATTAMYSSTDTGVSPFFNCSAVTTLGLTGFRVDIDLRGLTALSLASFITTINAAGTPNNTTNTMYLPTAIATQINIDDVDTKYQAGWRFSPAIDMVPRNSFIFKVKTSETPASIFLQLAGTGLRLGKSTSVLADYDGTLPTSYDNIGTMTAGQQYSWTPDAECWMVLRYTTLTGFKIGGTSGELVPNLSDIWYFRSSTLQTANSAFAGANKLATAQRMKLEALQGATDMLTGAIALTQLSLELGGLSSGAASLATFFGATASTSPITSAVFTKYASTVDLRPLTSPSGAQLYAILQGAADVTALTGARVITIGQSQRAKIETYLGTALSNTIVTTKGWTLTTDSAS